MLGQSDRTLSVVNEFSDVVNARCTRHKSDSQFIFDCPLPRTYIYYSDNSLSYFNMILRSLIISFLFVVDISRCQQYDNGDWIPLDQPCETCFEGAGSSGQIPEINTKKAQGRVLNLASPNQRAFFPEEIQYQKNQQPIVNGQFHQERVLPPQFLQSAQKSRFGPQLIQQGQLGGAQFAPQRQHFGPPQGQSFLPPQPSFRQPPNVVRGEDGLNYFISNFPNQPIISNGTTSFDNLGIREINQAFQNKPAPDYSQLEFTTPSPPDRKIPQEQVQLVYVPLENLRPRGEKPIRGQSSDQIVQRQNLRPFPLPGNQQPTGPKQIQLQNIQQDFAQQTLQAHQLEQQFLNQPQFSPVVEISTSEPTTSTTTQAPRKRKPHQPPLAVYMGTNGDVKVGDVLNLLKDAKTIAVQDTVGPNSPQVFVGPATLDPPEGYAKFELPYLSNIDSNRIERKTDQFPFFVAPLSYKAPTGYSKIPFPAPHVGSVVVSQPKQPLHENQEQEPREPVVRQPLRPSSEFNPFSTPSTRNQPEPSTTVRYQFVELEDGQRTSPQASPLEDHRFSQPSFVSDFTRTRFETTPKFVPQTTPSTRATSPRSTSRLPPQEEFVSVTQSTPTAPDHYTILEDFTAGQRQRPTTPVNGPRFVQTNPELLNSAFAPRRPQVVTEQPIPERLIPNTRFFPSGNQQQQQQVQYVPIRDQQFDFTPQKEDVQLTGEAIEPQRVRNQHAQEDRRYLPEEGRFSLPSQLPQVNAHLPGLINSLEDQNARDLLTPSLIPPSANDEVTESPLEYSSIASTTPEPTTTTEPPTTTTRRSRTRQRVPVTRSQAVSSSTIAPRRQPINRGRRPYARTTTERPENTVVSSTTENYPEGTILHEEVPRTNVLRSRYQNSDNAEQPKRTSTVNRQRFRTRGRPTNQDDAPVALTERTTADSRSHVREQQEDVRSTPIYRQQPVESYMEFNQQTGIDGDTIVRKQPVEDAPAPTQYILLEEKRPNEANVQEVKPTPKIFYQEVSPETQRRQPNVLVNPVEDTQYIRVIPSPQPQTEVPQEAVEVTTTRSSITRGRGRQRVVRPRVTSAPVVSTTAATQRSYEKKTTADEDEEEYYGFIRKPDFNRQVQQPAQPQTANKYSSRLSEGNLVPTNIPVQYASSSTPKPISPQQVYVDDKNTNLYVEVYTNDQQSSTPAPADYQLSTKLFSPASEAVTDKQYTIEEGPIDTPVRTRIRPRTRVSTRVSTTEHTPSEPATRRSFRTRKPASNEVTEEPAQPARNTRIRSRGKTHFKAPKPKTSTSDEDVEGGNYPPNFLRAVESQTQRSGFKITVEPGYEDNKDDQLPYSSIYRPRYAPRDPENGGEESQWTPGNAATYNNIPLDEKPSPVWNAESEQVTSTTEDNLVTIPVSTTEEDKTENEEPRTEADIIETTSVTPDMEDRIQTETESVEVVETTTPAAPKIKVRRRKVLRVIKRPTDVFETAESQNVPTAVQNSVSETDKIISSDISKTHVQKSEITVEEVVPTTTTTTESTLFDSLYEMFGLDEQASKDAQPIYEISENPETTTTAFDAEVTTILPVVETERAIAQNATQITVQKEETTTFSSIAEDLANVNLDEVDDKLKIIGTSTTTEISHETEICYRGRCIKSTTEA